MPTYEIVGSHFGPQNFGSPSKALIDGIELNQPLYLRAQPENQFDPNAIQVILKTKDIPESSYETLNSELSGFGKEISDILSQDSWHIGYIRKEIAKILRESNIVPIDAEIQGEFTINFSGKPMISLSEI
jgi:hypothetical protein